MKKKTIETLILGGGLAGLSACYHGNGIVFEKDSTWGGHARSHSSEGFVFDEGIHVLHTDNEYILNLLDEIDVELDCPSDSPKNKKKEAHFRNILCRGWRR